MNADSAHHSNWAIGEVVFGLPFLLSIALHFLLPLPPPQGIVRWVFIPLGILFITMGIWLIASARRELARFGQPTDPGHPTQQVVKTGIFAHSRNPMYLGAAVFILGIALALNLLWACVMLLISLVLCQIILILPEESYLSAKFGKEYHEYAAVVHRWLGRRI